MRPRALVALAAILAAVVLVLGLRVDGTAELYGDRPAARAAIDLRSATLTDVAGAVTDLGTVFVITPVVAAAALVARRRGRTALALALIAGAILVPLANRVAKEGWERPRPADALVKEGGYSYPSGHSSSAVTFVAVAALLGAGAAARRRRLLLAGGVLIAVTIGLTRVYLRVHHLSDVVGGLALGGAVHALCAAAGLAAARRRPAS